MYFELTKELEAEVEEYVSEIEKLLEQSEVPEVLNEKTCKKCAYYEYCYL